VQDTLCFAVGELLLRCKQRLNPVEFALHQGTLLLKHHLALYTAARRAAALRHPDAFPQSAEGHIRGGGVDDRAAAARRRSAAPRTCAGATGVGSPAAPLSTVEGFEPTPAELAEVAACQRRASYIVEELVRSGSLHPAFTFGNSSGSSNTSSSSGGSGSGTADASRAPVVPKLNPPGTKPALPELAYLRFVVLESPARKPCARTPRFW
jgi:hypothetical protein